jgi:hypothetical protein
MGSVEEAIALQKPLANDLLRIVAKGAKDDQAPADDGVPHAGKRLRRRAERKLGRLMAAQKAAGLMVRVCLIFVIINKFLSHLFHRMRDIPDSVKSFHKFAVMQAAMRHRAKHKTRHYLVNLAFFPHCRI